MRQYTYTGIFKCGDTTHEMSVKANGFMQATFLLTAKAINAGKFYQLYKITNENEKTVILLCLFMLLSLCTS